LQKQKERFVKLFHRQLSIPLVGNEQTLQEFSEVLSDYCVESDINIIQPTVLENKLKESSELLKSIQNYEITLYSTPDTKDEDIYSRLLKWKSYFNFELQHKRFFRLERLYERYFLECYPTCMGIADHNNLVLSVMLEYMSLLFLTLKNYSKSLQLCHKLLKIFPSNYFLRIFTLLSVHHSFHSSSQSSSDTGNSSVIITHINLLKDAFQKGITAGFFDTEEYYRYYFCFANCVRRSADDFIRHRLYPLDETRLLFRQNELKFLYDELLSSLKEIQNFLVFFAPNWLPGWDSLCYYQSNLMSSRLLPLEAILFKINESERNETLFDIVNDIVQSIESCCWGNERTQKEKKERKTQFLKNFSVWESFLHSNPQYYYCYQEYLKFLICRGEYQIGREVYKKISSPNFTFSDATPSQILKDWHFFEDNYGGSEDVQISTVLSRILQESIEALQSPSLKVIGSLQSQEVYSTGQERHSNIVGHKRGRKEDDEEHAIDTKKKRYKVQFDDSDQLALDNSSSLRTEETTRVSSATDSSTSFLPPNRLSEIPHPFENNPDGSNTEKGEGTEEILSTIVQFKNLPFGAKLPEISEFFSGLVPFKKIEILYTKAGASRGAVNIEYFDKEQVQQLLLVIEKLPDKHLSFQDRQLTMTTNIPSLENLDPLIFTTVFVNHLPLTVTEKELESFFASCGTIVGIHLAQDKRSGEKKVKFSLCCFC
jgi:RNA recognition motif-containing protein